MMSMIQDSIDDLAEEISKANTQKIHQKEKAQKRNTQ
jgi:hypothetical protein